MDLSTRLRALQDDLRRREGKRDAIISTVALDEKRATQGEVDIAKMEKAIEVLQAVTETRRQEMHDRVEALVTRGLRAVFGRADLEFFFRVTVLRDVPGIQPCLRSKFGDKVIEADIVDGHGGGISDVVGFLLRVIVLSLTRPRPAPVMVLDETFRHVSLEYLRGCATLMRELNRTAGIQFILVTHKPELLDAADVIYEVGQKNGHTVFTLQHDLKDDVFHQEVKAGTKRTEKGTDFDGKDLIGGVDGEPGRLGARPGAYPGALGPVTPNPIIVQSATVDPQAIRQRVRGKPVKVPKPKEEPEPLDA